MDYIKTIEAISQILNSSTFKGDTKILKKEFESVQEDLKIIKTLLGLGLTDEEWEHQKIHLDWNTFKIKLIDYHSSLGFNWKTIQGGTIELQSIKIQENVGKELAIKLLDKSYEEIFSKEAKEHTFYNFLKENMPETIKYIEKNRLNKSKYYQEAKNAFSQISIKDKKFTYITSSEQFKKVTPVYTYRGSNSSKTEIEFGNLLENLLEKELNLEKIEHAQEKRGLPKYLNTDFYGYKRPKTRRGNDLEIFSIELKPSNAIDKISEAISQAVNYKEYANRTYIAIPRFSQETFYDEKRFTYFLSLCKGNGIGIISVDVEPESHEVTGISIILEADRNEISEDAIINQYSNSIEFCPLCNKFIVLNEDRKRDGCGWSLNDECMKILLEQKVMQNLSS